MTVQLADVWQAHQRLKPFLRPTPMVLSHWLSDLAGAEIYLKLETLQPTGSFKVRGAFNRFLVPHPAIETGKLIAVSAGNHGAAVSYAAQRLGCQILVIAPETAPAVKREKISRYAARLEIYGKDYDEAENYGLEKARQTGSFYFSPYNDPAVIAGQGTVAMEIFEEQPQIDTLLVPVGGGGLIAGVGIVGGALSKKRVVGIQPEKTATFTASFQRGQQTSTEQQPTLADGLAGNLEPDSITVPLALRCVHEMVTVSEESIATAIRESVTRSGILVEGAAAVGVAALLEEKVRLSRRRAALILTGRNIDRKRVRELFCQQQ